jgi:hypothetical protein
VIARRMGVGDEGSWRERALRFGLNRDDVAVDLNDLTFVRSCEVVGL